jgi:glycosyltransferase involved in cell wall biosynthesis
MRLNWFSPLPPQRTDIAQYTARIAPALTRAFQVAFWTDLKADRPALPPGADVRTFNAARARERNFNRKLFSGLNVYNLGNDYRFHAGIARLARMIPGIVILHDTRLHDFVFGSSSHESPRFSSYLDLAGRLYGPEGEAAARSIVASGGLAIGKHLDQMPFVELFIDNAIGLVCHSKHSSADLRQRSDAPILTLPLPFKSLVGASQVDRTWTAPWRFVMFGYINQNRRVESVLRALASWRDAPDFRFDIYGTLWDHTFVEKLVAECGLESRTTIHGLVSEQRLDDGIAAAHLAFNLRYPTMGEASGGILRSWALATPALVTNSGWYAELPESVARKISVDNEIADINRALSDLVKNPSAFERMGLEARKQLADKHSPEAYVDELATALDDLPHLMARFASRRMLQNVAVNTRAREERRILLERASERISSLFFAVQ